MSAQKRVARDRISSLPDEILGKILSSLWTNRAATTSVLSKRWRNVLAHVDNLEFNDASGGPRGFPEFVEKTLALFSNSRTAINRFSLNLTFDHEDSRVNSWIRTALERGCLELHLENVGLHRIETEFFTSNTLVELTICNGVYPSCPRLPHGTMIFPALKTLSLISVRFADGDDMYQAFISGCPVLEHLSLHYSEDAHPPNWSGVVSSPSIKKLTIVYDFPSYREAHYDVVFETPSLVYLDYSSYVADGYEVDLASLVEARLDLPSWEHEDDESDTEDIFGDVTDLVAGISNVKTLHLSAHSLEVFHLCCKSMPVFHNLLNLSFESDKERGWQALPLLLNNSPNLTTLVIQGLVHQVTDRCGDACACIPNKIKKKEQVCCLSTCQVKVLHILEYRGTCRELKQMRHFLVNLKCLETLKVGVKVNHSNDVDNRYLRITNALMELPRVSSDCHIHFF